MRPCQASNCVFFRVCAGGQWRVRMEDWDKMIRRGVPANSFASTHLLQIYQNLRNQMLIELGMKMIWCRVKIRIGIMNYDWQSLLRPLTRTSDPCKFLAGKRAPENHLLICLACRGIYVMLILLCSPVDGDAWIFVPFLCIVRKTVIRFSFVAMRT